MPPPGTGAVLPASPFTTGEVDGGVARDGGGCSAAALEKATTSWLTLPATRSLVLEKGASLFFEADR
jgi:hypothetical protein